MWACIYIYIYFFFFWRVAESGVVLRRAETETHISIRGSRPRNAQGVRRLQLFASASGHSGPKIKNKHNVGALIIRIAFGGICYYNYDKETPKPYSNY